MTSLVSRLQHAVTSFFVGEVENEEDKMRKEGAMRIGNMVKSFFSFGQCNSYCVDTLKENTVWVVKMKPMVYLTRDLVNKIRKNEPIDQKNLIRPLPPMLLGGMDLKVRLFILERGEIRAIATRMVRFIVRGGKWFFQPTMEYFNVSRRSVKVVPYGARFEIQNGRPCASKDALDLSFHSGGRGDFFLRDCYFPGTIEDVDYDYYKRTFASIRRISDLGSWSF